MSNLFYDKKRKQKTRKKNPPPRRLREQKHMFWGLPRGTRDVLVKKWGLSEVVKIRVRIAF